MKVRLADGREKATFEYGSIGYAITKEGTELPESVAVFFLNHNKGVIEAVKEDDPGTPPVPPNDDNDGTEDENNEIE